MNYELPLYELRKQIIHMQQDWLHTRQAESIFDYNTVVPFKKDRLGNILPQVAIKSC